MVIVKPLALYQIFIRFSGIIVVAHADSAIQLILKIFQITNISFLTQLKESVHFLISNTFTSTNKNNIYKT